MRQVTQWQWQWHLDEVFVQINGETLCLWRAVDHEGEVLESYITKTRYKSAASKFLKTAMKRYGAARTDRSAQIVWQCDERHREYRPPRGRQASEQSSRKQPPSVPATRTSDAEFQADVEPSDIRLDPRFIP